MLKLLIIILFIPFLSYGQEWKTFQLVSGCDIFDMKGQLIRRFLGDYCLFLDDGRVISRTPSALTMYDTNSAPLWSLKEFLHHHMSLSPDGQRILAIGGATRIVNKKVTKMDKVMVISLKGEILHEITSDKLMKQVLKDFVIHLTHQEMTDNLKATQELSHFNSVYEIPKLDDSVKSSFLKEGSIIVNGLEDGLFILTPDLKEMKFHLMVPSAYKHRIHDAQILPNGHLIYFNNVTSDFSAFNISSAIQEYDLSSKKVVENIAAEPKQLFYSPLAGSVQKLDADHFLFTHYILGTYIYSLKEKRILTSLTQTHQIGLTHKYTQQVKALNLSKFLSHWK